ncbi:uncharacterized protein [Lolium perenne]|uniref:uncharacterized protein n=1 Tax=Lolium perenne TaxID=4522 RepID=UPI003A99D228
MKVHGERKQSQWSNFFDCWQKKQQPLSPTPSLSLSHSIPHSPPRFHQPPGAARASSDVAGVGDHGQVPDELRDGASRASSSRGCEGELGHGTEQASQLGAARERSSRDGTGEVRHSRRGRPRRDAGADELRDGAARASSSRGGEGELGHGAAGQPLARGGRGRAQRPQLKRNQSSPPSQVLEGAWMGRPLKIWKVHPLRLQRGKPMRPTVCSPQQPQPPHHRAPHHVKPRENWCLAPVEASHEKQKKRYLRRMRRRRRTRRNTSGSFQRLQEQLRHALLADLEARSGHSI